MTGRTLESWVGEGIEICIDNLRKEYGNLSQEKKAILTARFDALEIIRFYLNKNGLTEHQIFGRFISEHRILQGFSQDILVKKLNELGENRTIDVYTGARKVYSRPWLSKVENGTLAKNIPSEVRNNLHTTLGVSEDVYEQHRNKQYLKA